MPHWGISITLGYLIIYITRPTGGGGYFETPLITETPGPILKIQAAFETAGKTVPKYRVFTIK